MHVIEAIAARMDVITAIRQDGPVRRGCPRVGKGVAPQALRTDGPSTTPKKRDPVHQVK